HLDWFSLRDRGATALSLVCIGAFPGVARFFGLGQLTGAQLAKLFPARRPVTPAQVAVARDAWAAFRAPDPTRLAALLREDTTALPFLAAAIRRHLEEFPSVGDGLSRTEREALSAVRRIGPTSAPDLFRAVQDAEERPFMGDTSFFAVLRRMSRGEAPLVSLDGARVTLTETGRRALEGRADAATLSGVDRWLGGVRLDGRSPRWRWDRAARRIVASV